MITLYHNEMSSSSQKVRLCLSEKGLAWESRPINLRNGEQQEDWYRKLNPKAVVPTLVLDGEVVRESTVINEYLEERFAGTLMPRSALHRAWVRLWSKQVDESIHDECIAVLAFVMAFREPLLGNRDMALQQIAKIPDVIKRERRGDLFERGLESVHVKMAVLRLAALFRDMEAALAQTEWLAGPSYTLADVSITPYLTRLEDLNLAGLFQPYPHVQGWFERCNQRPSYAEAILKWDNAAVISNMRQAGSRHWPAISQIAHLD